jgi:hypothetical protein
VADAIHSPTAVDGDDELPLERICELAWEASDLFTSYCYRKDRADSAAHYLALEGLAHGFEDLFRALDHVVAQDPRYTGAPFPRRAARPFAG